MNQKIVRVRENNGQDLSRYLDDYTETWNVLRVLDRSDDGWLLVLLEQDEEESAIKQKRHEDYLAMVSRIKL